MVRTFVHKIEDEIQSPVDQFSTIRSTFSSLTANRKLILVIVLIFIIIFVERPRSHSTFSLVSQNLVVSRCEKCSPSQKIAEACRWLSRIALNVKVNSPTESLVSCSKNEAGNI